MAEQLVEVPVVFLMDCVLVPQKAEQLVHVPIFVSQPELQQRTVEQPSTYQFLIVVLLIKVFMVSPKLVDSLHDLLVPSRPCAHAVQVPAVRAD